MIGGICFRPFPENGFLEIAFLAVSVDFQIRVRTHHHHHPLFFFSFNFIFVFLLTRRAHMDRASAGTC